MNAPQPTIADDITKQLRSLPPLPDVAQEIITKMSDEFVDGNTVADIVARDPAISARLIGVANSSYFGLAEPVADMRQVVNQVLGVDTVRSMAIALSAQSLIRTADCPEFDTTRFWRVSLSVATCAQRIAGQLEELGSTERAFSYLLGLCHNLGLAVLASIEADRLNRVLADVDPDTDAPLDDAILEEFGTSSKKVTVALATHWQLPEPLLDGYHRWAGAETNAIDLAFVLRTAIRASQRNSANDDDFSEEPGDVDPLEKSGALTVRERDNIDKSVNAMRS